jgi:hypothetical protein
MMQELGMRIVHTDDNTQILLDSGNEKFEQGTALILISHFLLKLRENRLKFFGSIEPWDFSGRDKGIQIF